MQGGLAVMNIKTLLEVNDQMIFSRETSRYCGGIPSSDIRVDAEINAFRTWFITGEAQVTSCQGWGLGQEASQPSQVISLAVKLGCFPE
jgi:hypothetical protein